VYLLHTSIPLAANENTPNTAPATAAAGEENTTAMANPTTAAINNTLLIISIPFCDYTSHREHETKYQWYHFLEHKTQDG